VKTRGWAVILLIWGAFLFGMGAWRSLHLLALVGASCIGFVTGFLAGRTR